MTIKSCLELLAQADATIQDNTTGDITAAEVRALFKDIVDTFTPAYGGIDIATTETLSATPTVLAPATVQLVATPGYFTTNLVNGSVTRTMGSVVGGTEQVVVNGEVEGANNNLVRVEVYRDGAPTGYFMDVTCRGAGRPVGFNIAGIIYHEGDATYDLRATGDAGSYVFTDVRMIAQAQAVRSFV